MRVPNCRAILATPVPEILSSTGADVWRKAPVAFPDSSSVLDKFQSAKKGRKHGGERRGKEGTQGEKMGGKEGRQKGERRGKEGGGRGGEEGKKGKGGGRKGGKKGGKGREGGEEGKRGNEGFSMSGGFPGL